MRQADLPEYVVKGSFDKERKTLLLYRHLEGGIHLSQAARLAGMSKQLASYYAAKWVRQGFLVRISRTPALFAEGARTYSKERQKTSKKLCGDRGGCFAPHRLGATYFIKRRVRPWGGWRGCTSETQVRGKFWIFRWLDGDFTVEAHTNKVKVWGLRLRGGKPDEAFKAGVRSIRERALAFCEEQGVSLSFDRVLLPTEWTISDEALSDYVRVVLDLDNEAKTLARAEFCIDRSHPENVEVRKGGADDAVAALDWLLTDGRQAIEALAVVSKGSVKVLEDLNERVEAHSLLLEKKKGGA